MKFKKESDNWPKESLKRSLLLNYPGCKSTTEALAFVKSQKNETPSEIEKYERMRQAIIDIEVHLNGFDIVFMDTDLRIKLGEMPLKDLGDVQLWKEAWMRAIPRPKIG